MNVEYSKVTAFQSTAAVLSVSIDNISEVYFSEKEFCLNITGNIQLNLDSNPFSFDINNAKLNLKVVNNKLYVVNSTGLSTEFSY